MLVPKEVIRPGTFWYRDEATGAPRKLVVTPELTKHWHDQGNAMLSAGLTVPVPFEHDFQAHPMTPAEKLQNNAGWVKNYEMRGDRLFGMVDILDPKVADKLPGTIRWTSPWINSFTDGNGKEWNNVISHLALTTRPRIVDQQPFESVAAALSMATTVNTTSVQGKDSIIPFCPTDKGVCLTNATRLTDKGQPSYPITFSMVSGAAFAFPPSKGKKPAPSGKSTPQDPDGDGDDDTSPETDTDNDMGSGVPDDGDPTNDDNIDLEPFNDPAGDVSMTELLCDLLGALGVVCEHSDDESAFKRNLYNVAMTEIHKRVGESKAKEQGQDPKNRTNPPGQPPNNKAPGQPGQTNPLIQQEQQPMYMGLSMNIEEINKLDEPLRSVALSMHEATVKANAKAAESEKLLNSLRDKELATASTIRAKRAAFIARFMPGAKQDIEAMLAMPGMALSMGDGGAVIDPMEQTLRILEKGMKNLPKLLTTEDTAMSVQDQPTDADVLSDARIEELANMQAAKMGVTPAKKAS